jgi:CheY-like chemotaxis protein
MAIVLLVEGDDQVRVLAESYLEEQGHEVLSAGTAPGALALLAKTSELDLFSPMWISKAKSLPGSNLRKKRSNAGRI